MRRQRLAFRLSQLSSVVYLSFWVIKARVAELSEVLEPVLVVLFSLVFLWNVKFYRF